MSPQLIALTAIHTIISLVALLAGCVLCLRYMKNGITRTWTGLFLLTAVVTSITGFFFPVSHVLPSHIIGVIALVVLAVALYAYYSKRERGGWRNTFRLSNVISTYLLAFVGVAQAFMKVPPLAAIAPSPAAPLFIVAQTVVMIVFIVVGIYSVRNRRTARFV